MTNLQAAMGLAQLEQLEEFIAVKMKNYQRYQAAIQEIPGLSLLPFREGTRSNHWFYALLCNQSYPLGRNELIHFLDTKQIQTRPIWGLIHEQPPYRGAQTYHIEKANDYWEHVVNIPCSTSLTEHEVAKVVDALK